MSNRSPAEVYSNESDQALLQAFADAADEAAFAEVVRRYAGFVQAVARRTTGNADMTDEIVQSVFAVLARRATAATGAHLAGWLHRTTVFIARRHGRTESRHRRKLSVFAAAITQPTHDRPPAWHDLLPLLDEGLQRLSETDRRVLIMRYFEDLPYAGIAVAIGKSEEAARKQTTRALDRLRDQLRRRGATSSTAGLAGLLSAHAIAPPAHASSALAAGALKSAPSIPWPTLARHSIHHMSPFKLTSIAVLALMGTAPILWQEQSIASAHRELAELESAGRRTQETAPKPPPIARPNPATGGIDIEQVAKDVETTDSEGILTQNPAAAEARLASLSVSEVLDLLAAVPTLTGGDARQRLVEMWLYRKLGQEDPLLGIRWAPEILRRGGEATTVYGELRRHFEALLKVDPDAAIGEFQALRESRALDGKGGGSSASVVHGHFVGALMAVRPAEAIELYGSLDLGGRLNALGQATMIDSPEIRKFLLSEIPKLKPRWQRANYSRILASELSWRGLEGVASVFRELQLPAETATETLAQFLSSTNTGQARASLTPGERLDWLRTQVSPEEFAEVGGRFLGLTHEFREDETQSQRHRAFREYDWGAHRDQAIAAMFKPEPPANYINVAEALSLVVEIRDPSLRVETLRLLARRFEDRPTALRNAVEAAAALTAEEKSQIFQP